MDKNITEEAVKQALKTVLYMPKSNNIVDLDMLKNIQIKENKIRFTIEVPEKNEKIEQVLKTQSIKAIKEAFGADFPIGEKDIIVHLPQANPMSYIQNIVAVASGKGGVGKSTIAVNLAIALARQGFKTALMDADIYGPSIPTMMGLENEKPEGITSEEKQYIKPFEKHGIKCISIGFFVDTDKALIWRGPMASGAVQQLYHDTAWGKLDYLIIDLPPGTGDIHLSLVQTLPLTAAVVVSTPQKVALDDAQKAVAMFNQKGIEVPVLGMLENMAWFTPKELPENKYYLFGKEGTKNLAEKQGLSLLGQIPIVQSIRESGDIGNPIVLDSNDDTAKSFMEMAMKVDEACVRRNLEKPPTKKVEITEK
jgi:ATP-binding protein involved in chromosome partitioning